METKHTRPDSKAFEVQQHTVCGGWENTWNICEDDGTTHPQTFETREEAQAELDEFFRDIAEEIEYGERPEDGGYERTEFRIVPVSS